MADVPDKKTRSYNMENAGHNDSAEGIGLVSAVCYL